MNNLKKMKENNKKSVVFNCLEKACLPYLSLESQQLMKIVLSLTHMSLILNIKLTVLVVWR